MACPGDVELASFVDGTMADAHRVEIEAHIDVCRTCRQTVSEAARRGPRASDVRAGDRVGRYQLLAPLGAGAMGVVYTAHDPELDRRVAVKLVASGTSRRQERLAREARALARISHPNVVPVFDVGAVGDRLFIAMELVAGETLRAYVESHAASRRARQQLLAQAATGLAAAHAAGVVHRDFKPDNVLVGTDGRVRVSDFGLAAETGDIDEAGEVPRDVTLTRTGALLGTPAYMAPEQLRGERADAASDQFALCVTAWEVLFGQRPFAGADVPALLAAIERGVPAVPARIDRALAAALTRGLAFDPTRRHAELGPIIRALGDRRRASTWIAVAAAGAALVGGGLVMRGPGTTEDPCARAGTGIDEVWNAPAQQQLEAALARTGAPLASAHAGAAATTIDAWTAAWRDVSGATCRAHRDGTRSAALFDRQQACLARRRDELATLLALSTRGDVEPARVPQLASRLGDLDACTATTFGDAPALTVATRAQLDGARHALATARTQRQAGKYLDAIRALEVLRTTVAALPDAALAGEVAWELAMAQRSAGKLAAARDGFSAAAAHGEAARDDALKARAWIEMLALVGDEVVELDEAARLEPLARAALTRAEAGPELRAALAAALGRVELRKGRFKEAIAFFDEAIAQQRARTPLDRYQLANLLNSQSGAYGALGEHATMLRLLDEGRALAIAAVGKDHPDVAASWSNRVEPLHFLGRTQEAMQAARTAVEMLERGLGGNDLRLAKAIENLAVLHAMSEDYAEAMALFDRSRAVTEQLLGPDHADVGQAWLNIASAARERGDHAAAVDGFTKAIAIWERALGREHIDLARPLLGLAKVHLAHAEAAAARPLAERALAIRAATPGNPAHLAHARFVAGQAAFGTGDRRTACEHITAALGTYAEAARTPGKSYDEELAEIRAWLGEQRLSCADGHRRAR